MSLHRSAQWAIPLYLLCCILCTCTAAQAQTNDNDSLTIYWHKAFFAEVQNDPHSVIVNYDKVRLLCDNLPIDVREWFKGTSYFGIARAKATLHDKVGTQDAISKALSRHFWNFSLIQSLNELDSVCGKAWIDSLCSYWIAVRDKEMPYWHSQPTLLLKPKVLDAKKKYPVLIVLHGGNDCYERLVTRLSDLSDSLGIITVFPAGVHRLSEVTNSWDGDTLAAEVKIDALMKELAKDPTVDIANISLFGYSQGSQIAYDYGFAHSAQVQNIIAFSGFAPTAVDESELRSAAAHHMKIFAVSGSSDSPEFLRTSRELQQKAERLGLSFNLRIEPDLPHGLPLNVTAYFTSIWRLLYPSEARKENAIAIPNVPNEGFHSK